MLKNIDILILFAEKDDENASQKELGWVSQFKVFLELVLYEVLGTKPQIMLKNDSTSVTVFEPEKIDFLIVIVSENFIASKKCIETLNGSKKTPSSVNHHHVFKVMKLPVLTSEQPLAIRNIHGYNMYSFNTLANKKIDFFSPEAEKQYWMEMLNLAYNVRRKMSDKTITKTKNKVKKKTVFLAETSPDLSVQRSILERELQRYGCNILPRISLSTQQEELEASIKKDLEGSDFSIHLIGGVNTVLENTDQSIVTLQNQLAAEQNVSDERKGRKLFRLIWIAPGAENTQDEDQVSFIRMIKRNISIQDKIEISEAPLEDFKGMVRTKLAELNHGKIEEIYTKKILYLIYDPIDQEAIKPYLEIIKKTDFLVITPIFESQFAEARKQHIKNLTLFDLVLIFQDKVNTSWVYMKALDILKAPGFGRKKPILGKAIIAPEERTAELEELKNNDITLICNPQVESLKYTEQFLLKFA